MNAEADDIHLPTNIGNPGEFTMNQLAEQVGRTIGRELKISYMPLPADDPKQRQPNIDRARSLLEWEPEVPLAEGLQRTVAYFDSVIDRDTRTAATPAI
jgi:UDP-glucuronate decarboxylase